MTRITGFQGAVLTAGDVEYDDCRRVWNGAIDRRPALIARCTGVADVVAALRHARKDGREVCVRGGGHGVGGLAVADGALMVDLSPMKGIWVDPKAQRVTVQAGVVLGELDRETQVHGLAVPVGINTTTGIAGLALGGGIGWLMRRYGLTLDNLLGVQLVTAGGDVVEADEDRHPDLFWAVRGAGPNFGVITSFTFRCHRVGPNVLSGPVVWALEDAAVVLAAYRDQCDAAPDSLTTIAGLRKAPPAPWLPPEVHGRPVLQIAACHSGDVDEALADLRPLRSLGRPLIDALTIRPFLETQALLDATVPQGWCYYWKSHDVQALKDDLIDTLIEHTWRITSPRSYTLIPHLGGAVTRVREEATAYSHRSAGHAVNINAVWLPDDPEADRHVAWVRDLFAALEPYSAGVYLNFLGAEGPDRVRAAYGEAKWDRLSALKRTWDPGNFFHHNQNVPPAG